MTLGTTDTALPDALQALTPFSHDIEIAPGVWTAPDIHRVRNLRDLLFPVLLRMCGGSFEGLRVLDVACNCGGFSFLAHQHGATEVLGIDARPHHIQQAEQIAATRETGPAVRFQTGRIEQADSGQLGVFDVVLLLGIMYHLQDPIGVMRQIALLNAPILAIDSHVHFDADANEEDFARWWMLPDMDGAAPDGPPDPDTARQWAAFRAQHPVNYGHLPRPFHGSPQTRRERQFSATRTRPAPTHGLTTAAGDLVLVPNRKALIDLLRAAGYPHIVEVIPPRFAPEPYLGRHRTSLIAFRDATTSTPKDA
jgi:SAM-dependent methyltransferase